MIRLTESQKLNKDQQYKFQKVLESINEFTSKGKKRRFPVKTKKTKSKSINSKRGVTPVFKIAKSFNNFYAR